jgi:hypothetical protein
MTDKEIEKLIRTKLSVPLWPHAGQALNLGRWATYQAALEGEIPCIEGGSRKRSVPTTWLRKKLRIT